MHEELLAESKAAREAPAGRWYVYSSKRLSRLLT
jgi:hypothetical protein